MPSNMILVYMRCYSRNWLIGKLQHFLIDIANAKPRINKQTSGISIQQIAMRFLSMAIFTDNICICINSIYCKPIIHYSTLLKISINS